MSGSHATRSPRVLRRCLLAVAVLAAAAGPAAAAGSVQVSFAPSDRFVDAGDRGRQRTDNLLTLSLHLQRLGQRELPDGQSLKIEVLDVDLAGRMKPLRSGEQIRVVNGRVDWPRITLRWTLSAGGNPLRSGEETVADMNYLVRGVGRLDSDPLRHEKAMLDGWFRSRFATTGAVAARAP